MELDTQKIRALLDKRDEIDRELADQFVGVSKKVITCSACNTQGHTARTCPSKQTV